MIDPSILVLQSRLRTEPQLRKSRQEMDPMLAQNCLDFSDQDLARRLERERKGHPWSRAQKLDSREFQLDRRSSQAKIQASLDHHQVMRGGYIRQSGPQWTEI